MKLIKNQNGFSAFEAVIIVVALVAIGAAGYFAYQARQDKADYSVNVPPHKKAAAPAKTTSGSVTASLDATQARTIVTGLYEATGGAANAAAAQPYITQKLASFVNSDQRSGNPFTCGQAMYSSYAIKSATATAQSVDVAVSFSYPSGDQEVHAIVVNDAGRLKVDAVNQNGVQCGSH